MKVLIVEDNRSKLNSIKTFLKKSYSDIAVHDALSYTAGLRRIYEEGWDLLLLDMTLPTYDMNPNDSGGDKKSVAGKEIMKRMIHRKIMIPTIIITQFDTFGDNGITIDSLNQEFEQEMSEVWKGTVIYEKSTWMKELKRLIDSTLGYDK